MSYKNRQKIECKITRKNIKICKKEGHTSDQNFANRNTSVISPHLSLVDCRLGDLANKQSLFNLIILSPPKIPVSELFGAIVKHSLNIIKKMQRLLVCMVLKHDTYVMSLTLPPSFKCRYNYFIINVYIL